MIRLLASSAHAAHAALANQSRLCAPRRARPIGANSLSLATPSLSLGENAGLQYAPVCFNRRRNQASETPNSLAASSTVHRRGRPALRSSAICQRSHSILASLSVAMRYQIARHALFDVIVAVDRLRQNALLNEGINAPHRDFRNNPTRTRVGLPAAVRRRTFRSTLRVRER